MSARTALYLCYAAFVVSVLCFAVHAAATYLHWALPIPAQGVTFLGVFGLTWPLWGYAAAVYRRHLAAK